MHSYSGVNQLQSWLCAYFHGHFCFNSESAQVQKSDAFMVDLGHLLEAKVSGDFFGRGLPSPLETTLGMSRGQDTWGVLIVVQLHLSEIMFKL